MIPRSNGDHHPSGPSSPRCMGNTPWRYPSITVLGSRSAPTATTSSNGHWLLSGSSHRDGPTAMGVSSKVTTYEPAIAFNSSISASWDSMIAVARELTSGFLPDSRTSRAIVTAPS